MKQLTEANQKLPPLPDGLRYAETLDEEAGFRTSRGVVPRRWANDPGYQNYLDEGNQTTAVTR